MQAQERVFYPTNANVCVYVLAVSPHEFLFTQMKNQILVFVFAYQYIEAAIKRMQELIFHSGGKKPDFVYNFIWLFLFVFFCFCFCFACRRRRRVFNFNPST